MDIKRIIAREGLIILGFIALFIICVWLNFYKGLVFVVLGYPVYLVLRFITWALKVLFPQYFYAYKWSEVEKLLNNRQYLEALDILEELERSKAGDQNAINSLKKTCIEAFIIADGVGIIFKLLENKQYDVANKIGEIIRRFMLEHREYFGIKQEYIQGFIEEIKTISKDRPQVPFKVLEDLRKKYIEKLEASSEDKNSVLNFKMLTYLVMIPIIYDLSKKGEVEEVKE